VPRQCSLPKSLSRPPGYFSSLWNVLKAVWKHWCVHRFSAGFQCYKIPFLIQIKYQLHNDTNVGRLIYNISFIIINFLIKTLFPFSSQSKHGLSGREGYISAKFRPLRLCYANAWHRARFCNVNCYVTHICKICVHVKQLHVCEAVKCTWMLRARETIMFRRNSYVHVKQLRAHETVMCPWNSYLRLKQLCPRETFMCAWSSYVHMKQLCARETVMWTWNIYVYMKQLRACDTISCDC
jgi:hypothetical protein